MPTDQTDKEKAIIWLEKVKAADKLYDKWRDRFKTDNCEQYYEGFQWDPRTTQSYSPYVINLIFSSIEVKMPALMFEEPISTIKPKPGRAGWNSQEAHLGARLKEDILNTFLLDDDNDFPDEVELAILDSFFRFGILEVGFSTDWIENPNAGKPVLKSDETPYTDKAGQVVKQPEKLPEYERNFVKRIPAKNFRVGALNSYQLKRCNWCGYFEYYTTEDVLANKNLKNTEEITWSGSRSAEFNEQITDSSVQKSGDLIKIWHIWDNRAKKKYLLADSQQLLLKEDSFTRLPLFPLMFHHRLDGFYPLPPVFNWLPAQQEINESREMMRIHRRRFIRKYIIKKDAFEQSDRDKLEHGPDGTIVETEFDPNTVIAAVPLADLGSSAAAAMVVAKDDFNIISGTSSEQRGEADRTTATQATLISQRSQIRESRASMIVARWLASVFKEILLQMRENNVLPYWVVKTEGTSDPNWENLLLTELDDFDFEVKIDISSMSPLANDNDKKAFLEFLAVLHNYPMVAMSPDLVAEVADKLGYRNQKVLKQFMEMATIAAIGQIEQGKQQLGALAQRTTAQATPPAQEQVNNQMQNQVGLPTQ